MKHIVRISYFEADKSALIEGPVRQLVEQFCAESAVEALAVMPHWKRGPHINLVINCEKSYFDAVFYPACESIIGNWLVVNPSITELDPVQYERLSQQLALVEIESPPYLPLRQNNTLERDIYTANDTLKLDAFKDLKVDFISDSLPLVFELLALKKSDKRAYFVALSHMLAVCGTCFEGGGLARGFNSFRSHAEFFYVQHDTHGRMRQQFDAVAEKYRDQLRPVIEKLVEDPKSLRRGSGDQAFLSRWFAVVDRYSARIKKIVAANYEFLSQESVFVDKLKDVAGSIPSELHQQEKVGPMAVAIAQDEGQAMLNSEAFIAYRTLVNFFYFLLPILGISPAEKYCICNMTASTVEQLLDITWQDLMIPGHYQARQEVNL
jgi:hypothetical protein